MNISEWTPLCLHLDCNALHNYRRELFAIKLYGNQGKNCVSITVFLEVLLCPK
jgi:hypothetical protein